MKKIVSSIVLVASLSLAVIANTGCVGGRGNIVAVKTTTLGFEVSSDPSANVPHVRLGLIRNFYQVIPVSTNAMHAPDYATSMNADLRLTEQNGGEDFATGQAALLLNAPEATNNTVAKIGAAVKKADAVILTPAQAAKAAPAAVVPASAP